MSFKESLQRLAVQINERKEYITNEETTKQALIIPFLQVLGYDVFNPLEVRPEYVSDFGKKKAEKVDYAIFKDGSPIIFIEAKSVTENLNLHDSQLARYFNATPEVKLAILTNGITYKFFTDIGTNNIMDENPFATVNITELSPNDIEILSKFKKDSFETTALITFAEELIYTSNINNKLRELFKNPPDEFIRYLIKDFSDTRITSNVLERFRPIVKKAISTVLLEIVTKGLTKEEVTDSDAIEQDIEQTNDTPVENEGRPRREVVTSQEELESFEYVKKLLSKNNKDVSALGFKDTTGYFAIYNKNVNHWFLRLKLDGSNCSVITRLSVEQAMKIANGFKVETAPKGHGESRIYIDNPGDLSKLDNLILCCFEDLK